MWQYFTELVTWPHIMFLLILTTYLVLVFTKNLPSITSFKDFTDTINSAGGHIVLLSLFSFYFFKVAIDYLFRVMAFSDDIVSKRDAIIMSGITFITGTAFGGAWGAMLKTMSGGQANGKYPPPPPPPPTPPKDEGQPVKKDA